MAIITYATENLGDAQFVTWETLTTDDVGQPWQLVHYSDKTVQIFGDFGSGATVLMQGSNDPRVISDPDNAVWFSLTDAQGNAISKTALAGETILENPRWIRPYVSGGTSPDIDVIIAAVRS